VAHLGLSTALRSVCESFWAAHAIRVTFHSLCDGRNLPPHVSLGFFRIAQEALRNIAKHARVSTAVVTLEPVNGWIRLRIEDTGVGFDVEHSRSAAGLGLFSMRERAHMIGATFHIQSAPGQGTVVEVSAPASSAADRSRNLAFTAAAS
jgi:signal transduction histidine kinase